MKKNIFFLFCLIDILFAGADGTKVNPDFNSIAAETIAQQTVQYARNLDEDLLKKIFQLIPNLSDFAYTSRNNLILSTDILRGRVAVARTCARTLAIRYAILRIIIDHVLDEAKISTDKAIFEKYIRNSIYDSNYDINPSILRTAADLIFSASRDALYSISDTRKSIHLVALNSPAYFAIFRASNNTNFVDNIVNVTEYDTTANFNTAVTNAASQSPLEAFYASIIARNVVLDIISTVKYVTRIILPIFREDSCMIANNVLRAKDNSLINNITSAVLRGNTADAVAVIDNFVLQNEEIAKAI